MPTFDLQESLRRAEERFGDEVRSRRPRQDRGRSRLPAALRSKLEELLQGQERPPVRTIMERLADYCSDSGFDVPARATIYQAMARATAREYRVQDLPRAVRESLYNLAQDGSVPGHQLAFHCLNYGSLAAVSFAAGLPWLALYQAARLPGWRQRSRGLLGAILKVRRI